MKGGCGRLPSSCALPYPALTPQKGNLEKEYSKKQRRQRGRECLRFNSTKRICQQNLITVIYSKTFIVLLRQAHPCLTLFCYQSFFFSHPITSFLVLDGHSISLSTWSGMGKKRGPSNLMHSRWVCGSRQNKGVKQGLITVAVFTAGHGAHCSSQLLFVQLLVLSNSQSFMSLQLQS